MTRCCKKCDYEFSIWGEPIARDCNDSNCECHKKMNNQNWEEGYKQARAEILKWAEDKVGENHDKLLAELLEELQTLINKDKRS